MANHYIQAAFAVTMTAPEARLISLAEQAIDILDANDKDNDDPDLASAFTELGSSFATAFPPKPGDPFASFTELFDDPSYPYLSADISIGEVDDNGLVTVHFSGDQINTDNTAELIFRCAKSALPCGFHYAYTCDKLRTNDFGGGAVVITADGVQTITTYEILDRALSEPSGDGSGKMVLTIREPVEGLLFWNNEDGFGNLARATVFSDTEAAVFTNSESEDPASVISCGQGEWHELPKSGAPCPY